MAVASVPVAALPQPRFEALWQRCFPADAASDAEAAFEQLKVLYAEPHRRYHTPAHIGHCLGEFDLAADAMDDADAVEMALWFHDAVHDPRASDNEVRSAALFSAWATSPAQSGFNEKVGDLILMTVHCEQPRTTDQAFVVDIDLSSFALPWPAFQRDSVAVRKEFAHLSDADFYPKHIGFLRSLLARPTLFFTPWFRGRCEAGARANIARHIEDLRAHGVG